MRFSVVLLSVALTTSSFAADRPNVLFAIADDASYPHMSAYGTDWVDTPSFDRVARDGLLFHRCYTPNAKCAPSRACLLTGRNSWQLEEAANHWCYFPTQYSSYVEVLGNHGYVTGMTGKGWAPGVAKDADGKKRELAGKPFGSKRIKPPTKGISPNDYAGNFADFLDSVGDDQPFCFWYGCTEPHRVYQYESGAKLGGKSIDEIDEVPPFWPDNEVVRNDMLDYAFEIEHFDTHLGRMLDDLDRRGQLDNTLVVVTSDNGMPFPSVKGQEYEMSNHLPLAIMWPAGIQSPGRQVDDFVSFIDLAPTYLDLAKVEWATSEMSPTVGKSLRPIFENTATKPHREFVVIGKERHDIGRPGDVGYPIRGIVKDSFLLIENHETSRWPAGNPETGYLNTDGSPTKTEILNLRRSGGDRSYWNHAFGKRPEFEMYNISTDPYCINNIVTNERYQSERDSMQKLLDKTLLEQADPRALGDGDAFDAYPYANVCEAGFYEKFTADPNSIHAGWVEKTDAETQPLPE